jgi:L-aspartate oxidase
VTTNPDVSTGDGIALAYACGAEVMDLEFTQFHPTALRLPGAPVFLISEAVRGEGALLYSTRGERFMPRYDERAELAPRDVVALAEHREMLETGSDHVLLDITEKDAAWLAARFPQIYRTCQQAGLDMAVDRIPVSPAAHYMMGGVRTNTWGETTVPGLFAVGEVACTGVHGANRLASNSLLETVVFARRAVERLFESPAAPSGGPPPPLAPTVGVRPLPRRDGCTGVSGPPHPDELRELMWSHVGIEREGPRLAEAAERLARWQSELPAATDRPGYELRSMMLCALLAAEAALLREESRGAHYRSDFPERREEWKRHIVFAPE